MLQGVLQHVPTMQLSTTAEVCRSSDTTRTAVLLCCTQQHAKLTDVFRAVEGLYSNSLSCYTPHLYPTHTRTHAHTYIQYTTQHNEDWKQSPFFVIETPSPPLPPFLLEREEEDFVFVGKINFLYQVVVPYYFFYILEGLFWGVLGK